MVKAYLAHRVVSDVIQVRELEGEWEGEGENREFVCEDEGALTAFVVR